MEEEAIVEQHQHDEKTQLPYDILFYVLLRLPTKYHYQLKCVAKVFNSVLDDPYFRIAYSNRFPDGDVNWLVHTSMVPSSEYTKFTQMINGLVCYHYKERIFLYKISTQERTQLPLISKYHPGFANLYFGFDPTKNVYKLLMLGNISHAYYYYPKRRYQILTIGESTWRSLPAPNFTPYITKSESICARGVIYWALDTHLSSFDLKNEVFVKVILPIEIARCELNLARYRNSFALIKSTWWPPQLTIWMLRGTNYWDKYTLCVPYSKYKCTFMGNLPSGEMMLVQGFNYGINMSTTILVCDVIRGSCRGFEIGCPISKWIMGGPFGDVISSCHEEEEENNVFLKDLFGLKEDQVQSVGSL